MQLGLDAGRPVQGRSLLVRTGVLTALDPLPASGLRRGRQPHPGRQLAADRLPAVVNAVRAQTPQQQMHGVVGRSGDEQVRTDAVALRVPDRPRFDLPLQAAEGDLDLGQLTLRSNAPMRNRTMALLSDESGIVAGGERSGEVELGREVLRQGRDALLLDLPSCSGSE